MNSKGMRNDDEVSNLRWMCESSAIIEKIPNVKSSKSPKCNELEVSLGIALMTIVSFYSKLAAINLLISLTMFRVWKIYWNLIAPH